MKKPKIPIGLNIVGLILAALFVGFLNRTIFGLAAVLVALLCANLCARWSMKRGSDGVLVYFFGFFFGLIGLFIYFLYINFSTKEHEETKEYKQCSKCGRKKTASKNKLCSKCRK